MSLRLGLALAVALLALLSEAAASSLSRTSVDVLGEDPNAIAVGAAVSDGALFVAFDSSATDLVPGDANEANDVFVRDRQAGVNELVSVTSDGVQGDRRSNSASISADGRYVAFLSVARNLVPNDDNAVQDVFVRDRAAGTTIRASVDSFGAEANGSSENVAISANGRYVVFSSSSTNLDPLAVAGTPQVYVHDLATRITTIVSVTSAGVPGSQSSSEPAISADGRFVAFMSSSDDLVPGDLANRTDVFLHDRQLGLTTRLSFSPTGVEGNGDSRRPRISADGRFVSFLTTASNLFFPDTGGEDVVVLDTLTGVFELASEDAEGRRPQSLQDHSLSPDGRTVAMALSDNSFGEPEDSDQASDIYVRCLDARGTFFVSRGLDSRAGIGGCANPRFATDGRSIGFESGEPNLVPFDFNGTIDVFLFEPAGLTLDSVTPSRASEVGGAVLTLHGTGFGLDASLLAAAIGGVEAPVLEASVTTVSILAPGGLGAADVAVASLDGCATLGAALEYVDPGFAARLGNVGVASGEPEAVLTVNGSAGDPATREVALAVGAEIAVDMATPAATPDARFALYAWTREPDASTLSVQPFRLGVTVFPTPLAGFSPQPSVIWNNLGFPLYLGAPDHASSPAPSTVVRRPSGRPNPVTVAFQGFIVDRESATARRVSVTNAVVLRVE